MSEKLFVSRFRKQAKGVALVQRIESEATGSGIPDTLIDYRGIRAYVEFKFVKEWPKRGTTTIKLPHFSGLQRQFLVRHGREAGHCYLFLLIGDTYLLFPWNDLPSQEGELKEDFISHALLCEKKLSIKQFLDVLEMEQMGVNMLGVAEHYEGK